MAFEEGNDVTNGRCQEAGDHQNTEPAHINAVVGIGDPLTKAFPATQATTANCGGHEDSLVGCMQPRNGGNNKVRKRNR